MQAQLLEDLVEVEPVLLQRLVRRVGLEDISVIGTEGLPDKNSWHLFICKGNHAVDVYVGIAEKTLSWIASIDVLSNRNTLHLLEMRQTKPKSNIFEFSAPEGVDVIGALQ